jgi:hypothetical protein
LELHLKIIGCILIVLALIHFYLPKRFNWVIELSGLSLINRQLMYVHTFFVAFAVFLIGVLCITASADMVNTRLGHQLAFGLFVFWATRLYFQFFVYSPQLWQGKMFEQAVHIVFVLLWAYLTVIFFITSKCLQGA